MLGILLMELREKLKNEYIENKDSINNNIENKKTNEGELVEKNKENNTEKVEQEEEFIVKNTNREKILEVPYVLPIAKAKIPKGPKQHRGKSKARRKRGVFLDADGSAKLEMSNDQKGKVSIVGEDISFSKGALTEAAQNVVFRHQFRRKHQPAEEEFEDEEEEEEEVKSEEVKIKLTTMALGDFISPTNDQKDNSSTSVNISDIKREALTNVELLEQLDKSDKENYITVRSNCERLNSLLLNIIESENETEVISLLSIIERITAAFTRK